MIRLEDIGGRSANDRLKKYEGKNPYIQELKLKFLNKKGFTLTDNQSKYVLDNFDKEPVYLNKVIGITPWLGEELQNQYELSFKPERILVEYMLADNDKTFHIMGKLKRNQKHSKMYFIPKTQVIDDPYFEDTNIDIDFEKYVELDEWNRNPYNHQRQGVEFLLSRNKCILADDMGLGKAESVDNLVFTPTGRQKIGDLKPGDYVIGSNGKSTLVEAIYPQGTKDLYRITFNDGYSILCCKEHLWTVTSNNGSENNKNRPNRYTTLSVEEMLDENLIKEQIGTGWNEKKQYKFKTYYKQKNGQNKWQIPIVQPIQFENQFELPIEPYLLGLGLGDGHFRGNKIFFGVHKDDFDELFNNTLINETKKESNTRRGNINIGESLTRLKLDNSRSHTKFIPDIYKYSSIDDRLAILQGLMDTDGHCMTSKKRGDNIFIGTEYCTVSEQLANDVAEIVHSLGGIVRKSEKIGSYKKEDGTRVVCKKAYRLNIKLPDGMNPFRLKRKADLYKPPQKYKVGRYIKNIELETQGEAVCIQVAADDHLYVTEHGIVTHNTYQTVIAALESGAERILIVCPSSLKLNWEREINAFCDDTYVVNGRAWDTSKFTIINYDILKNFHQVAEGRGKAKAELQSDYDYTSRLVEGDFDLVIVDEAHYLKNPKSIRGKIMTDLCVRKKIERVWLLTGTPIANRPMDYFNLLHIIQAPIADNWQFFARRYCDGKMIYRTLKNGHRKQIWLTTGASNLEELSIKTRNIMLRRKKEEVLDMPDKSIVPLHYEMSKKQWDKYDDLWDEYMDARKAAGKRGNLQRDLVELILLRKFISMEMIPKTIELAESAIEQGHKVIIFTNFTEELNAIAGHFGKEAVTHNGPMSDKAKQKSVDDFQKKKGTKVFIGNIKSAGVGITLTEGDIVIFNSFDWVPGNNEQAEDRAYRIGQNNNVTVYYQLFHKTISDMMWATLHNKKEVIATIMGEKEYDEDEILHLMADQMTEYYDLD